MTTDTILQYAESLFVAFTGQPVWYCDQHWHWVRGETGGNKLCPVSSKQQRAAAHLGKSWHRNAGPDCSLGRGIVKNSSSLCLIMMYFCKTTSVAALTCKVTTDRLSINSSRVEPHFGPCGSLRHCSVSSRPRAGVGVCVRCPARPLLCSHTAGSEEWAAERPITRPMW